MRHKIKLAELVQMFESGAVFTAFDTETTGLYPSSDRVIEIGAVKFNKTGTLDTYETLIYPEMYIPQNAYRVHGIDDAMLSGSPVFAAAVPGFLRFIADTRLIAHNAGFDTAFINAELQRAGYPALKTPSLPPADTVALARKIFPSLQKYNLQFLARHFGIPSGKAHRARDDAYVCSEVFLRCIGEYQKRRLEKKLLL